VEATNELFPHDHFKTVRASKRGAGEEGEPLDTLQVAGASSGSVPAHEQARISSPGGVEEQGMA
jgi:hypothetical protein